MYVFGIHVEVLHTNQIEHMSKYVINKGKEKKIKELFYFILFVVYVNINS